MESNEKAPGAYRTISEVADDLGVPQHVLRFWETKFAAVRPMKRAGNRRYYRPQDMDLLRVINRLLYVDGYTIRGVQKLLRENGPRALVQSHQGLSVEPELRDAALEAEGADWQPEDAVDALAPDRPAGAAQHVAPQHVVPQGPPASGQGADAAFVDDLKRIRSQLAQALQQ